MPVRQVQSAKSTYLSLQKQHPTWSGRRCGRTSPEAVGKWHEPSLADLQNTRITSAIGFCVEVLGNEAVYNLFPLFSVNDSSYKLRSQIFQRIWTNEIKPHSGWRYILLLFLIQAWDWNAKHNNQDSLMERTEREPVLPLGKAHK